MKTSTSSLAISGQLASHCDGDEILADPQQRATPILTIALSVGYQSTNPFNRAFKTRKGETPSAFRDRLLHTDS